MFLFSSFVAAIAVVVSSPQFLFGFVLVPSLCISCFGGQTFSTRAHKHLLTNDRVTESERERERG